MVERPRRLPRIASILILAGMAAIACALLLMRRPALRSTDSRLAAVERRDFMQRLRRTGTLQPVNRHPIFPKVRGTILELADDGALVEQGALLFQIDPKPYEERLTEREASLRRLQANWVRDRIKAEKDIREAQDVVETRKVRLELEELRLKDMESGPTPTDELNARVALENARALLVAREEELAILVELADQGFVSQSERRQKELDVDVQRAAVAQSDVAYRKLHTEDPVKLGEQRLKVLETRKGVNAAKEKVAILEQDLVRATDRYQGRLKREEGDVKGLRDETAKTRHVAPAPGIVLYGTGHHGSGIGPGREVHEGFEAMTVCDLRKMKAVVAIDEGHISRVQPGQPAGVRNLGQPGAPLSAKVTKVAEKGRDEFEEYEQATRDLTGKANRQVFDVEVEIQEGAAGLRPGQRVEVEVDVCGLPGVLVIPRAAVHRDGPSDTWVFVPEGGVAERRSVKILAEDELWCAIEGLQEGQQVWRVRP